MVVNLYWRYQRAADITIAALMAFMSHVLSNNGIDLFKIDGQQVKELASNSFSASVSLLGLAAATVAFVFSAIDAEPFSILRQSKSRNQMWNIFSFTLICLLMSSGWSFIMMLLADKTPPALILISISTFVATLVAILLFKFTWVMVQIISVKAAQG